MTARFDLHEMAAKVALFMPDGWKPRPAVEDDLRWVACLDHPADGSLYFHQDRDRVTVAGGFVPERPGLSYHGLDRPTIGVAAERGPEVVAREIRRRLLPRYSVALAAWRKRVAEDIARDEAKAQLHDRLAAAIGPVGQQHRGDEFYLNYRGLYGTVAPIWSDVKIELRSCPPDLAVEVCETIARWAAGG